MSGNDAESEALRVRRKQKGSQPVPDSDKHRGSRRVSKGTKNQPLRIGGENRTAANPTGSTGGTISGGILNQLIQEARDQLEEHQEEIRRREAHIERINNYIRQLEELLGQLMRKIGEEE
jgi:hypothetical protein